MSARLYLRPTPRAFFLLTDTHALVFRQPGGDESKAARSVVIAEFLPLSEVDTAGLVPAGRGRGATVEGVLGVTSVPSDRSPVPEIFLLLLTSSSPLPPLLPGSSLRPARVVSVEFHSLTSTFWDPPGLIPDPLDLDDEYDPYAATSSHHGRGQGSTMSQAQQQGIEDPCTGMKKYLESGGFFHADQCGWDITARLGGEAGLGLLGGGDGGGRGPHVASVHKTPSAHPHPLETFDERFVWNASLLAPLLKFRAGLPTSLRAVLDAHALLLPIMQGFVGSTPLASGWSDSPEPAALALISRLSCKRAGARFRTRGIDDDGNVANFVETETLLTTGSTCVSYVQVRGSVPLFWQQPSQGLSTLQQRVEITRPPEATQPAVDKHFLDLLDHYEAVHAINLMGQRDAEAMLSSAYAEHFAALRRSLKAGADSKSADGRPTPDSLVYTPYDFHSAVRVGGHEAVRADLSSMPEICRSQDHFNYTAVDTLTGEIIQRQHGVFRVNCLDCLDRTNYVQEVLSSLELRDFLTDHASPLINSPSLWAAHRELWADNGDRLSKTYAGTGALNTSATRSGRKTFAGLLSDATKSVGRAYINNFQDKGKQMAIDMLLGLLAGQRPVVLFDPIGDSVHNALAVRKNEYAVPRDITFYAGTWNVNGRAPDEPLGDWLFPDKKSIADVYLVAFQEIVELTPQQIVQTDPAKKRVWENAIMGTFGDHFGAREYIMLRSEQLVGTALMIIVRSKLLPAIRNVEYADKKTGLQGLSGNKGGVGVRFDLFDTSVCLMTCHLAAGQNNYADRNADYRTISHGLHFLRGKTIDSHDIVIWAADFNYRIDLPNDQVRDAATRDELDVLVAADQLRFARDEGEVFNGYDEGALTFRPTYKYDNGTDVYDSSEKQRIPSWTDRVLFKGNLRLRGYHCASLRTSDHRPVYAVLDATVYEVNETKKAHIADELAKKVDRKTAGKTDDRVEVAAQHGVRGLVKEFTSVSMGPSPVPSPKPRPPAISRDNKPRPKGGWATGSGSTVSATPTSPAVSGSQPTPIYSAYSRLGQPPPLPARNGHSPAAPTSASAGAVPYEPRRRAAPPPPSDFRKLGLPPTPSPSTAPVAADEITPVATGDFVLVPSPSAGLAKTSSAPALPPRPPSLPKRSPSNNSVLSIHSSGSVGSTPARPAPPLPPRMPRQNTLDMDAPPPAGLAAPVAPDNAGKKDTTTNGTPSKWGSTSGSTGSSSPTRDPKDADKKAPPPLKPKPALVPRKSSTSSGTATATSPGAPTAPGSSLGEPATLSTSPTKSAPPLARPKPEGLKGKVL